MARFL
jgi:hypothetical protein